MRIIWTATLSFCVSIVVSTLDVSSSTGITWTKYRYGSEFDGFRCVPDDTLFLVGNVTDPFTCGQMCYNTNQCLDFFFQSGNHQCIGCRVHIRSAYSTKRIEPHIGSTHFSEHGNSLKKECYIPGRARLYSGYQSKTRLNKICQRWDTQKPHSFNTAYVREENLAEKSFTLAENYCRDPDAIGRPWCFTTDPNDRWDYCDIPPCYDGDCYTRRVPRIYQGYKSATSGGVTCQRWDQQSPHTHQHIGTNDFANAMTDISIQEAKNYCRTPYNQKHKPWCITTDENIEWDYCDVEQCNKRECFMLGFANLYEGVKNVTKGNLTCQRWDQQSPHKHGFTSLDDFPDASIKEANNYCRSPNRAVQPWCYTTNENDRWDFCDVAICVLDYCFYESASTYQGRVYYTESRVECQRWDSTEPHNHDFGNMPSKFPDATVADAANYCRDPSGRGRPWCFTTDPNTVWDWCNVKKCWDNNI